MTTLVRKPTEVRLDETMLANFKKQVMVSQVTGLAGVPILK
jgi:hypothetical protein